MKKIPSQRGSVLGRTFFLPFLILISSFVLVSCHCKKKTATTAPPDTTQTKRDFPKEGYFSAMVINYEMDACRYLVIVNGEKKLEPSKPLASEFQKDQLAVWVKYADKKGAVSACMAGQVVDITDIQLRK